MGFTSHGLLPFPTGEKRCPKQKAQMEKLKKDDIMIPPRFFDNIAPVLASESEAYLLSPILSDLTGFPPIDIFYGTKEVMIAYLPDMKEVCEKYSVPLTVHIGKGMMHCWGGQWNLFRRQRL